MRQDGQVRDELTVARYRAPGARRPGRPRHLRLKRRGTTLRIAWKPARHAGVQEVRVRLGDGRRVFVRTHGRRVVVRRVRRTVSATVRIRGVADSGLAGRSARARTRR